LPIRKIFCSIVLFNRLDAWQESAQGPFALKRWKKEVYNFKCTGRSTRLTQANQPRRTAMTFDITKTFSLVKGGLLDSEATWKNYLAENPGWQQTAMLLTGPLILVNVLLNQVFTRMTGGYAPYSFQGGFVTAILWGLLMAVISFLVAVFVFNYLAGSFKGKPDFSRAFAAVSLAAIPAWLAGMISGLIPGVGFLLALAGGILSLVFMYKIMPLALDIPDEKRTVHFVASLIVIVILNMFIGYALIGNSMRSQMNTGQISIGYQLIHETHGGELTIAPHRQSV
jgi:hypothetical protein